MKKSDELELYELIKDIPMNESIWFPDIIKKMKSDTSRVYYILEKWSDKGYINYGISVRGAWKEEKFSELKRQIENEKEVNLLDDNQ